MIPGGVLNLGITKANEELVANDWKDKACLLWRTVCSEKGTGFYVR